MTFAKCSSLTDLTLTVIVKYSVGYSFGVFISLEIIPFTQTVKGTSRAENHPVWTSNCTGDLDTICVAQLWLDTSLVLTRLLNQANPQYQGWAWTVQKFTNSSFVHEQLNFWTNEQSFFSTEWTNEQVNSCSFLVGNFWTLEQLMTKSSWTFEQMNSCSFTVSELLNKRTDSFSRTNEHDFLPRTFEQII